MRRSRRRAVLGRLGWALGLGLLAAPSLAEAQLFPNRTIRRERTPCASESPYYKSIRQNYYGYFPTCWSRFPPGWGCPCPNPEMPNWQASLAEKPLKPLDPSLNLENNLRRGDDVGPAPGVPGPLDDRPDTGPAVPLPDRRGAFDGELTPKNPIVPPGTGPGAGAGGATLPNPDPVVPPSTSRLAPAEAKPEVKPAATTLLEVPRISPPAAPATALIEAPTLDAAAPSAVVAEATLTATDATAPTAPAAPSPVSPPLPDASTPPAQAPEVMPAVPAPASPLPGSVTRAMNLPPTVDGARVGAPAQAPQKKGILTGLFDRQGRKRR